MFSIEYAKENGNYFNSVAQRINELQKVRNRLSDLLFNLELKQEYNQFIQYNLQDLITNLDEITQTLLADTNAAKNTTRVAIDYFEQIKEQQ